MLDVPTELVTDVAELLADERSARGTRAGTRALSCEDQAVFALVWFRERRDVASIGRGLGISQATAYRYLDEAIDVLAAHAPDLHDALQRGHDEDRSHVVLDGKVVDTDRLRVKTVSTKGKTIDAWYSGKTRDFGGNIQALTRPDGLPVRVALGDLDLRGRAWRSPRPDRRPRARARRVVRRSRQGPSHPGRPRLRRRRPRHPRPGQAARWRTLQHVTLSPSKISIIARAALVLTHFERGCLAR